MSMRIKCPMCNYVFDSPQMKHKLGCQSSIMNPITVWGGEDKLMIVGYECPECKAKEKLEWTR